MRRQAEFFVFVDGAYVSSEALKAARDEGRELRGPAPASPDRGKATLNPGTSTPQRRFVAG